MGLVVEWLGLGVVVCLVFETFVAAVHAVVGANTRTFELLRSTVFPPGKRR